MTTPVLIDTDFNVDDWMAIALLLGSPSVSILGVTVTGTGMIHLTPGVTNALNFLATCGQQQIPVATGASAPLNFSNVYPASARTLADTAFGITLATNPNPPQPAAAWDFLYDTAKAQGGGVTLLAIGGMTNVAMMFNAYPDAAKYFSEIVIMGGAIDPKLGNVNGFNPDYSNTVAEWNMFVDPLAAQIVFQAGVPITLVPIDASADVPLDLPTFAKFVMQANPDSIATLLIKALTTQMDFIASGGFDFWDPLAAAYIVNSDVVGLQTMQLSVNQILNEENDTSAQTVQSSTGTSMNVAMSGDPTQFWTTFITAVNSVPNLAPGSDQ